MGEALAPQAALNILAGTHGVSEQAALNAMATVAPNGLGAALAGKMSTNRDGAPVPASNGFICWTTDPGNCSSGTSLTTGALYVFRFRIPYATPVTNVIIRVNSPGVLLTSGRNFAGLWKSDRTLSSLTADQSVAWASGGLKIMPLVTPYSAAAGETVYMGLWCVSTGSTIQMQRGNLGFPNDNLSDPLMRIATADTGLTTTPPSPFGVQTAQNVLYWAALS